MKYDFEMVGKQTILNQLRKDIKGKADYLQTTGLKKKEKLVVLKDIERMARDAYKILYDM